MVYSFMGPGNSVELGDKDGDSSWDQATVLN
jgi:hypothetical protein